LERLLFFSIRAINFSHSSKYVLVLDDIAGDAIVLGDSRASTCSESSVKSYVTAIEDAATNLKTPLDSFPTVKTSEFQFNNTETNSVKKPEDQNISGFMSAGSPVLNRNETSSSEMNLTPDQLKAGKISKAVIFSQATLVSPVHISYISSSVVEGEFCGISMFRPYIAFVFVYSDCGGISFNI